MAGLWAQNRKTGDIISKFLQISPLSATMQIFLRICENPGTGQRERSAVRCACKLRDDCSFHLLAARNADFYHALLAGAGLQQRPSAPAASPVKPCLCQHSVPAARAIACAAPLPLLPRADGCCVSIRHRSQALGLRLPSPKNKSGRNPASFV